MVVPPKKKYIRIFHEINHPAIGVPPVPESLMFHPSIISSIYLP